MQRRALEASRSKPPLGAPPRAYMCAKGWGGPGLMVVFPHIVNNSLGGSGQSSPDIFTSNTQRVANNAAGSGCQHTSAKGFNQSVGVSTTHTDDDAQMMTTQTLRTQAVLGWSARRAQRHRAGCAAANGKSGPRSEQRECQE